MVVEVHWCTFCSVLGKKSVPTTAKILLLASTRSGTTDSSEGNVCCWTADQLSGPPAWVHCHYSCHRPDAISAFLDSSKSSFCTKKEKVFFPPYGFVCHLLRLRRKNEKEKNKKDMNKKENCLDLKLHDPNMCVCKRERWKDMKLRVCENQLNGCENIRNGRLLACHDVILIGTY